MDNFLNNSYFYNLVVPLLDFHPPNSEYLTKIHLHTYVHCNTIHISQDVKTTQVLKDKWVDKETVLAIQK